VLDLEGRVVQAELVAARAGERKRMMIRIAAPEGHEVRQCVREFEAERTAIELLEPRTVASMQHDVIEFLGLDVARAVRVTHLVNAPDELHQVAIRIPEADRLFDTGFEILSRRRDDLDALRTENFSRTLDVVGL